MFDLKSRLIHVAGLWAAAHADERGPAPLSRLGKRVAGDANFFQRIADGGGLNVTTVENFARHLADPANWPGGAVPREAVELAHVTGIPAVATRDGSDSAPSGCVATGENGQLSGEGRAAA